VITLNSDVQVAPGSLEQMVETLRAQPDCGFSVPKLLFPVNPAKVDSAGDAVLLGGGAYRIGAGEIDLGQYDSVRSVLCAAGTACAYRRSLLQELGGFDEDFFGFLEDVDLSLRAQLRGRRCLYVPGAVVVHQGGATFRARGSKEVLRLITRNQIWVVVKNYPGMALWRALPRILLFQFLWMVMMLARGFALTYMRGLLGALWGLPRMLRKRRQVQHRREITAGEFWGLLRQSEQEIAAWQKRLPQADRSLLLRVYFGLCGWPRSA
jgi:hypothetical protein